MNSWIYGVILLELAIVSWIDIKTKKISNLWFPVNIVISLVLRFVYPDFYVWSWDSFVYPVLYILIGFVLFYFNVMGAGDSKFLASLYLVIPLGLHWAMVENILISTIMIGSLLITWKLIIDFKIIRSHLVTGYWKGLLHSIRSRFSFAPVILLSWLLLGVQKWS